MQKKKEVEYPKFTTLEEYWKPYPEGTTLLECMRLNQENLAMIQSQPGYEEWRRRKKQGAKEFKL